MLHLLQVGFKDWLRDLLLWVPRKIWEAVLDALAAIITAIPVPSWIDSATSWFEAIPDGVLYVMGPFQVGTGLAILLGAWVLRFLIRRIPVIG